MPYARGRDVVGCASRYCSVCSHNAELAYSERDGRWIPFVPEEQGAIEDMPRNPPRPFPIPSPTASTVWATRPSEVTFAAPSAAPTSSSLTAPPVFGASGDWVHFPSGTRNLWFMSDAVNCTHCGNAMSRPNVNHATCLGAVPTCCNCGTRAFRSRMTDDRFSENEFCAHLMNAQYRGENPPIISQAPFAIPGIVGLEFTPSSLLVCTECRTSFRAGMSNHSGCVESVANYVREQRGSLRYEEYGIGANCGECGEAAVRAQPHGAIEPDEICHHLRPLVKTIALPRGTLRRRFVTVVTTLEMALEDGIPPQTLRQEATNELRKLILRGETKDLKSGNVTAIASVSVRTQQGRDAKGRVVWR